MSEADAAANNASYIDVAGLRKSYGTTVALDGVDFQLERGKVAAIIGPSGCGKSTFLRCLNLLETPTAGRIRIGDALIECAGGKFVRKPADIPRFRRHIGMVFQSFDLFPHLTALDNVRIGLISVKGMPQAQASDLALATLDRVGMRAKALSFPRELSGGQAQRVGIARAVAMEPDLLLFDEVTSALDPELVSEVLDVILDLADEGRTMVLVTHEMEFALQVAHRVAFFDLGRVVESGAPRDMLLAPKSDRLREFLARFSGGRARPGNADAGK